jgi:predicted flap endonuclease-1-like 5' DNA nuclease
MPLRWNRDRQWDAGGGSGCGAGIIQPFAGVTPTTSAPTCRTMSLFPDQPPPPSPPEKPKLATADRQIRQEDRLKTIRLRMAIGRELDERGITTPAAIAAALDLPEAEATKLMTGRRWREGDVARLEAAAARLGV